MLGSVLKLSSAKQKLSYEGDGRHTEHDDAVEHGLEKFEHVAVEARTVGEGAVGLMPLDVEDVVGEVVILVNDEVES